MFSDALTEKAQQIVELGIVVATAESCTGGLVVACLTEIPGSADVVDRGFVTYTNQAKTDLLGVPEDMLQAHGAVSEQVARAMAEGAIARSRADVSVSITGIAGPGGGSADKPVGLVWFGGATRDGETVSERHLFGDIGRAQVRAASVGVALGILERLVRRARV
ncbi:MAG: CinA family protein [Sphingomonadales bacterium]